MPGPVPKRSEQRIRRNKTNTDKVTVEGKVDVPEPEDYWHPIARDWFVSLQQSGQSKYYEASDWQTARYLAEAIHRNLDASRFSAQLFASIQTAMNQLLVTEGARRRLRMEIDRVDAEAEADKAEEAIEQYLADLT